MDIYGSILDRPVIKKEFDPNYPVIVRMMDEELIRAKQIYDHQMAVKAETGSTPIHKNMAKVSGSMKWTQELRERITIPMTQYKQIEHPWVLSTSE